MSETTRRVIHVHPSRGDDLDGDGSLDAPFQTYQRAATVRHDGDIIAFDSLIGPVDVESPQDFTGRKPPSDATYVAWAFVMAGIALSIGSGANWWMPVGVVVALLIKWWERRA